MEHYEKSEPDYDKLIHLVRKNTRVGIVYTMWNGSIVKAIKDQCINTLKSYDICHIIEVAVPGSFELAFVCEKLTSQVDVIIAIGCLIQGETNHMQTIATAIASQLITNKSIPIIFGILTCETLQQAIDRISLGVSYAKSAMIMTTISDQIKMSNGTPNL